MDEERYSLHRRNHKKLNVEWLFKNKFFTQSNNVYLPHYEKYRGYIAMMGQYNRKGEPEGLVRLVWPNGDMYEGQYAGGCYSGFGVLY